MFWSLSTQKRLDLVEMNYRVEPRARRLSPTSSFDNNMIIGDVKWGQRILGWLRIFPSSFQINQPQRIAFRFVDYNVNRGLRKNPTEMNESDDVTTTSQQWLSISS